VGFLRDCWLLWDLKKYFIKMLIKNVTNPILLTTLLTEDDPDNSKEEKKKGGQRLTDEEITELLKNRDQNGLIELKSKYQKLILKICGDCLHSAEDAEECANDTLLAVWGQIPPDRPENLTGYICKIARRKAVDKLRYNTASIRNSDLLTELDECLPSKYSIEEETEKTELSAMLNDWLKTLDERQRKLFTLRYFFMRSVKEAAKDCSMSITAATTALSRLRGSLKKYLTERGMFYE